MNNFHPSRKEKGGTLTQSVLIKATYLPSFSFSLVPSSAAVNQPLFHPDPGPPVPVVLTGRSPVINCGYHSVKVTLLLTLRVNDKKMVSCLSSSGKAPNSGQETQEIPATVPARKYIPRPPHPRIGTCFWVTTQWKVSHLNSSIFLVAQFIYLGNHWTQSNVKELNPSWSITTLSSAACTLQKSHHITHTFIWW